MSDKDKADIRRADAEADGIYIDRGVIDPDESRARLNDEEGGVYSGALAGPAPEVPDDEGGDDLLSEDGWNEGDHPRDADGKFASSSVKMEAIQHVSKVMQSKDNSASLNLGAPSKRNVEAVKAQTEFDLSGFTRSLEASEIRHAMNRHSDEGKEALRGQVALKKGDFGLIPEIVEAAHAIELKGEPKSAKPQRLVYTALLGNHEYEYVEEIRPSKKLVALKTMRKS